MFLSQKPMLFVLNINEGTTLGEDLEQAVEKSGMAEMAGQRRTRGQTPRFAER